MKGKHMRRITIVLACAMMAPLAFGQPVANTSVVEHTGQFVHAPTQITTGAVRIGTVTAFNPGRRNVEPPSPIVVQSSPDTKPVSYMLGKRFASSIRTAEHSIRIWSGPARGCSLVLTAKAGSVALSWLRENKRS